MLLNKKIQKAIYVASHQHRKQKRKMSGMPYIVHPFSTAWLLSEHLNDDDIIAAALLHDVIEDTKGYDLREMEKDFGKRVVEIVAEVTEDKALPWKKRKETHIEHLKDASIEAIFITAADKIHNLSSLREEIQESGKNPWGKEFKSKEDSEWYHDSLYLVVEGRLGEHPLVDLYKNEIDMLFKTL